MARNFWGRKWSVRDRMAVLLMLSTHTMALFGPFYFTWGAFKLAFCLYVVTGLFGITLSYHRNLTHRSFKLPKLLEYLFAYCGLQALQGDPIDWVSAHRSHHKHTDREQDLHSPNEGFWFSHIGWMFDSAYAILKCGKRRNVEDLKNQWFYRFLHKSHLFHPIAFGAILYRFGGVPYLVWGMGVRVVCYYHSTFLVNSVCHIWGYQSWNTGDLSKNNWLINLLVFGEGWHNNHHAFEFSARHGIEWWEVDMTWYIIRLLESIGMATDIKVPTELHKQKMAFNKGEDEASYEMRKQSLVSPLSNSL